MSLAHSRHKISPGVGRDRDACCFRKPLKLYTLYAPPEHIDGTVHATNADAGAAHEHFYGMTTEARSGT